MSLYTVLNKNNVTFQMYQAWMGLGTLGYVSREKSRPILLRISDIDVKMKSGRFPAKDNVPGASQVLTNVTVIMGVCMGHIT